MHILKIMIMVSNNNDNGHYVCQMQVLVMIIVINNNDNDNHGCQAQITSNIQTNSLSMDNLVSAHFKIM